MQDGILESTKVCVYLPFLTLPFRKHSFDIIFLLDLKPCLCFKKKLLWLNHSAALDFCFKCRQSPFLSLQSIGHTLRNWKGKWGLYEQRSNKIHQCRPTQQLKSMIKQHAVMCLFLESPSDLQKWACIMSSHFTIYTKKYKYGTSLLHHNHLSTLCSSRHTFLVESFPQSSTMWVTIPFQPAHGLGVMTAKTFWSSHSTQD